MSKKLYRSKSKRMVSGVCGGLGEYFNIDETVVRLGVAFLTCVTAVIPGIMFYLAAAIIIPEDPM
ncbi:MAG TPA: PspC domain-containing protein [Firmicutes bacterium]|jgi:phage shock protein C|nr:PspC domain-containing protein [Bacillota bacterium]